MSVSRLRPKRKPYVRPLLRSEQVTETLAAPACSQKPHSDPPPFQPPPNFS